MKAERFTNREFVRLLVPAEPRIYAYIRAQIPHRADAEDVFQETVSVLWSKFDQFRSGTNFLSWALQVAHFEVRQFYRRRGQDRRLFSEAFLDLIAETTDAMSDELADLRESLAACLEKLKEVDRDIVRRYFGTGATIQTVAADVGRPVDTIKSVLKRSRQALYECIRRSLAREEHP